MLGFIKYWWRLHRLRSKLEREYRRDAVAVAELRAEGASSSKIYELQERQHFENRIMEDEISQIESRNLCTEANRFRVPIPHDEDMWEESSVIGGRSLTSQGFALLRSEIRKERDYRWQYWETRTKVIVTIATALTGLFGALIGWTAFWK